MDLLDSILTSMDKTATQRAAASSKQEREERARLQRQKKAEQEALVKWRAQTEDQMQRFTEDEARKKLIFPPLPKHYRQVLHEIAESHELASHSFGKEEELPGRYSVVFKKDVAPSPDEISVIASQVGEGTTEIDLEQILENSKAEAEERKAELERKKVELAKRKSAAKDTPTSPLPSAASPQKNYRDAGAYARVLQGSNSLFVLNTQKRDRRTIEEIQKDMKTIKRPRTEGEEGDEREEAKDEEEHQDREDGAGDE
ncbi:R3H domain containing protein [Acanthamoeba castellanii str. Neff]|uniref:R3H domain containing protein n=1 Tax=Acanthamoeba castellanii (strain ATCC 30010 / Neff) TaxID=1257118 RepID=L8GLF9_ACACF|nr:R3H domain containing protein [Acanthamoeba castellanii str. Neff]ELR13654.1 R3H domain containing protein [Acanthamoeba castellanii str. Neff]